MEGDIPPPGKRMCSREDFLRNSRDGDPQSAAISGATISQRGRARYCLCWMAYTSEAQNGRQSAPKLRAGGGTLRRSQASRDTPEAITVRCEGDSNSFLKLRVEDVWEGTFEFLCVRFALHIRINTWRLVTSFDVSSARNAANVALCRPSSVETNWRHPNERSLELSK